MDVGDPLTEAVCWNAAWHLVSRGQLAAADLATLIARRVGALPLPGVEVLLERAVGCADVYAPPSERAGIRERVAEAAARLAGQAAPRSPRQRALAAGFAAAAQTDGQLARLRGWLDGDGLPAGLVLTAGLRGRILGTLAARGLASDADLDALASLDPVQGEQQRATCRAMRPDAADKEAAWTLALASDQDWRMAQAYARGLWVPGQDQLMAGYLGRYLSQALPALDGREPRVMRGLARLLYPATLISPQTLQATEAAQRDSQAQRRTAVDRARAGRHPACGPDRPVRAAGVLSPSGGRHGLISAPGRETLTTRSAARREGLWTRSRPPGWAAAGTARHRTRPT